MEGYTLHTIVRNRIHDVPFGPFSPGLPSFPVNPGGPGGPIGLFPFFCPEIYHTKNQAQLGKVH